MIDTLMCLAVLVVVVRMAFSNLHVMSTVWLMPWAIAVVIVVPMVLVTEHYGASVGTVNAAENTAQSCPTVWFAGCTGTTTSIRHTTSCQRPCTNRCPSSIR